MMYSGQLKIAEVSSRFENIDQFVSLISSVGFKFKSKVYLTRFRRRSELIGARGYPEREQHPFYDVRVPKIRQEGQDGARLGESHVERENSQTLRIQTPLTLTPSNELWLYVLCTRRVCLQRIYVYNAPRGSRISCAERRDKHLSADPSTHYSITFRLGSVRPGVLLAPHTHLSKPL